MADNHDLPNTPQLKFQIPPIRPYFEKYILYETKTRFYLIGRDSAKLQYKILKVDRTVTSRLSVVEDDRIYSRKEITNWLKILDEANKPAGVKKICSGFCLLGLVKFTSHYYIYLVTKQKLIGYIGPHRIYSIQETNHFAVTNPNVQDQQPENEDRYRNVFFRFDLTQDFYYSPTYNLTCTLQRSMLQKLHPEPTKFPSYNDMFAWNHYLLEPLLANVTNERWIVPIIHGSFVQHSLDAIGRNLRLTLIARRSRLFAGARFIKRGMNEQGCVANDVEIEQILGDPNMGLFSNYHLSSYVQHRGSIPLYWAQINGGVMPKPPISLQRMDPYYSSTILHFMDLMKRYGTPIIVLNLIKSNERVPREMILREAYGKAIDFMNSSITDETKRIFYIPWDFKKTAKNNKPKLQRDMYAIAQMAIQRTGFFHTYRNPYWNEFKTQAGSTDTEPGDFRYGDPFLHTSNPDESDIGKIQTGAVRTNCIDSIDRTNAAQYLLGLCALSHQLHTLGLLAHPDELTFESPISLVLMEMYEMAGHQLALQYGGSGLAHTMNTFGKKSIVDQSKDFWTVVQRYYNNTFNDQEKQIAYNLFLGVFKPWEQETGVDIWKLETDYYLHMFGYTRELLFNTPWWVEPLEQHKSKYRNTKAPTLTIALKNEESDPTSSANIDFDDIHSTHKLSSFDQLLSCQFLTLKRAGVALPAEPMVEVNKEKSGLMRWLWNPKSPQPSPALNPLEEETNSSIPKNYVDPLSWCGMTLNEHPPSTAKYTSYCDTFALNHRIRKKRKRYADYKQKYQLTHYRKPKLGTDDYTMPDMAKSKELIASWENYQFQVSAQDMQLYHNYTLQK